jgi:hypothetical protein
VVVSLIYQGQKYMSWARLPLYTTSQASQDLGIALSPEAVISGPYGPALAMENELGCIIHIFGTSRPDPDLFKKYPVTHLALDETNKTVAERIYPDIMRQAIYLFNYNLNFTKVVIYKIAGLTGNSQAASYIPSDLEKAVEAYINLQEKAGSYYLPRYLSKYPENMSGNTQAGAYFTAVEDFKAAAHYYSLAVDYSKTDFKLHFYLGNAYIALADAIGDESFRVKGEAEKELSRKYGLGKFDFDDYIIRDPKDRENGNIDQR